MELASEMEAIQNQFLKDIQTEKDDQAKLKKSLVEKKKSLEEREESLSTKEMELKKQEDVIKTKFSKVRTDEQVQAQYSEALILKETAEKQLKLAKDHQAEADLKLTWVADRERAVSEKEATYKQKIEKEYQEKLKGLLK